LNDQKDYHAMKMAMEVCDFQKQDQIWFGPVNSNFPFEDWIIEKS
jgi:hypothetical protein